MEPFLHWWHEPPAALRYGISVLLVAAMLTAESRMQSGATVSLLLCAILFSAWFGGTGPGLLAMALAVLGFTYFFAPPIYSFAVDAEHLARVVLFTLVAVFIVSLTAAQRRAAESLENARDDLLKKNEALQAESIKREAREDKLREQAQLLDLTHDTIFVRDMNDVITYWNWGAEERYGYKKEEALGQVSHQLMQTVFPGPLAEIEAELLRSDRWEGRLVHTKRDGTQLVVASRWSLQRDEQGNPIAVLETNNDITEQVRAAEALREAQTELAHVNRVTTMGQLAATIAHEVNQPLAAAVTNAHAALHLLHANPPDLDEARQALGDIIKNGTRAGEVVNRVRELTKKAPPRNDWVDFNEAILEVVALTTGEVQSTSVSLETQLAKRLPLIQGDRIQLQQVALNLIINAIEATGEVPEGTRQVLIATEEDTSNGVIVTVKDSGSGLDPERFDRLFDAFYTTKANGMGMGLAICRSIVEAHGGRIWAKPNMPQGAIFQFALPAQQESVS